MTAMVIILVGDNFELIYQRCDLKPPHLGYISLTVDKSDYDFTDNRK
jgi:hypothetical protein